MRDSIADAASIMTPMREKTVAAHSVICTLPIDGMLRMAITPMLARRRYTRTGTMWVDSCRASAMPRAQNGPSRLMRRHISRRFDARGLPRQHDSPRQERMHSLMPSRLACSRRDDAIYHALVLRRACDYFDISRRSWSITMN